MDTMKSTLGAVRCGKFLIEDFGYCIKMSHDNGGDITVSDWGEIAKLAQELIRRIPLQNFLTEDELNILREVHLSSPSKL